ncbi:MAG: NAD(P)/FAD-dependent oxidoreductase [Anaerolineae bacterium]|nr:NAD(P)/FAD-dependent oxidoreductase [Anaerolineae bacterium]
MNRVIVIGAGVGGLATAALLAKAGLDVTVLEAHVYPGGCAGTFFHQGYRFDAGATLAAGFDPSGGMTRLGEALGMAWPVERAEAAMAVHLPGDVTITRWTDPARWREERLAAFGAAAEPFWRWQEQTADRLWALTDRGVPWPPQGASEALKLAGGGLETAVAAPTRLPILALDAFRPLASHLRDMPETLRRYIDGQLLISAQVTSERANALYGAAALDMPRRGVAHVRGGMGRVAALLAEAVRRHGGRVLYRQRVTHVNRQADGSFSVETQKRAGFTADTVIFNLPPWDAASLLGVHAPERLRGAQLPQDGWGAFMAYVGLDEAVLPPDAPLHRQALVAEPFGEGNSVFLSLSLADDPDRAPAGQRALTISTHTQLAPWWRLFEHDREAYAARKQEYAERLLAAAEIALPGLRGAARLIMPGTPVSFQRFTHRSLGWVGGFPQTNLFRAWAPQVAPGLWLVGDSIFPGQSVLAVALGGMRVAGAVMRSLPRRAVDSVEPYSLEEHAIRESSR